MNKTAQRSGELEVLLNYKVEYTRFILSVSVESLPEVHMTHALPLP
jgi:hypothetical protein